MGISDGLDVSPWRVGALVVGNFVGALDGLEVGLLVVGLEVGWPLGIEVG